MKILVKKNSFNLSFTLNRKKITTHITNLITMAFKGNV
jgi:hypothetical protein